MAADYPILEFDPARKALIEPSKVREPLDVPPHAVVCFFQDVIESVCGGGRAKELTHLVAEHGRHPVYELDVDGERLAVFHPGVGAPLAAAFLEEAIAIGCRRFVACGGAGARSRAGRRPCGGHERRHSG